MLSGVKFISRDQLLPKGGAGSGSDDSDDEKRRRRSRRRRDKEEKKRRRRRRGTYSSDELEEGSESEDSIDEEEEELRRSKRRRKRRRSRRDFSDDDDEEESSDQSDKKRGEGKGKRRGGQEDDDEEEEGIGGEELRTSEVVRKEMGLEWMLKSASRMGSSHAKRAEEEEKIEETAPEEVRKANPKEINPYLKDNGSGYPDEANCGKAGGQLLASSVVGDGGASWRLKALKRAKEQAAREGRKLEEVVEERWGSLGHLAASVSESRAAPARAHLHAIRGRKGGPAENSEEDPKGLPKEDRPVGNSGSRDYLRDVSFQHHVMRKPKPDSVPWKRKRGQNISSEDQALISTAIAGLNKFANDGNFMDQIKNLQSNDADVSTSGADEQREHEHKSFKERSSNEAPLASTQTLTANQLAAKILQLQMKGKHEEAEQLSREMEAVLEKQDDAPEVSKHENEGSSSRHAIKPSAADRRKREEDADLHLANKIMHNKQYSMPKSIEDEYDFGDAPSKKSKRKNREVHEKRTTQRHLLTQKERCLYCFENPSRPKHLVVAIGNFTYLMLPQFQPVVSGHCVILPLHHDSATRTVDKNVWEEIRNFKKCLLKMFAQQDKDVVFMETVISLAKQRRHCMIECIPVPYQVSNKAPMYFKKAIDEAEEEWSQHEMKKLIPTSGNLRQAIPENFPYFHVEFGLDHGFVHVIDDESKFSSGFGLNVVRGMLRLPEEDMHRRRRHESLDKQKLAVAGFMKDWEPFDWTKQLD